MHIIDIWVNCPSIDIADAITDALLDQQLIALSHVDAQHAVG